MFFLEIMWNLWLKIRNFALENSGIVKIRTALMTLHVFNPEHDLALASGLSNFTAPHAGRRLRADLGYLPALWAGADDCVLVEHVGQARQAWGRLRARVGGRPCQFVDKSQLGRLDISRVEPWGWDMPLRSSLIRHGVSPGACASEAEIADIRQCSHRRMAVRVQERLRMVPSVEVSSLDEVATFFSHSSSSPVVVKAPWSSSGRGVRFVDSAHFDHFRGWIANVIRQQGSVMVEPYRPKVKDFGMEFEMQPDGMASFLGLSLFTTHNGAYAGNVIASEDDKRDMISRYVPESSVDIVRAKVMDALREVLGRRYVGPLGVDMMIVSHPSVDGFLIHPCVEINLRRTMGHVAIAMANAHSRSEECGVWSENTSAAESALEHISLLPPHSSLLEKVSFPPREMQITLSDKYRIHINRL
jgi:hypothetical protein